MISVVNVQQMLQLEAEAESHLEEHALMRTAAFGLYIEILNILRTHFGSAQRRSIVGLIGPGNNGSDALWAMSLLSRYGLKVSAIDTTQKREQGFVDQLYTSSNGMWQSFEDMPDSIDLIIDGIAGLRNNLAPSDAVLDFVTAHPESLITAVDMPSCFDNDSATLIDADRVIVADYTVTFGYLKPCHVFNSARSLCGDVILVELPLAQVPEPVGQLMEPSDVSELLTELDTQSNKYSHGVLGLIAGSIKYPGAGVLTVLGSQWGGSGYIQYLGPRESTLSVMNVVVIDSLESLHPKTNVIVCGPGIDQLDGSINLLREIVLLDKTLLLDADAITLLSQGVELQSSLGGRKGLTILTPHHGEALRLAESLAIDTSESEHVWVSQIARKLKVLVAYKSAHGFIALPDGTFFFSDTTASALATAGTGDVLAGLMGSLIARHSPTTHKQLAHIAMGAVILHSLAAQLSEENSVNATAFDIAHEIRNAISILQNLGEE